MRYNNRIENEECDTEIWDMVLTEFALDDISQKRNILNDIIILLYQKMKDGMVLPEYRYQIFEIALRGLFENNPMEINESLADILDIIHYEHLSNYIKLKDKNNREVCYTHDNLIFDENGFVRGAIKTSNSNEGLYTTFDKDMLYNNPD